MALGSHDRNLTLSLYRSRQYGQEWPCLCLITLYRYISFIMYMSYVIIYILLIRFLVWYVKSDPVRSNECSHRTYPFNKLKPRTLAAHCYTKFTGADILGFFSPFFLFIYLLETFEVCVVGGKGGRRFSKILCPPLRYFISGSLMQRTVFSSQIFFFFVF